MKKNFLDPAVFKKSLQRLKEKLNNRLNREVDRVNEMIEDDRSKIADLQEGKADKATTLEGYGIEDALPSTTPYAKSSTIGGSASSFETSIDKSNKDLPIYFASPSATDVNGIAAHNNSLSFNPATGALKANEFVGTVSGVASEAEQFETPATIELTGDIIGKAESRKDWTISTTIPEKSITEDKIADNSISNDKLKNSSIKIGKNVVQLGGELNSLDGFQAIESAEFIGDLKGIADRAVADSNGNIINSTYLTKQEHQDYKRRVEEIESKVPAQASPENQLADKSYVVDQINSVSAYYLTATPDGEAFASKAALTAAAASGKFYFAGQLRVPTKNDYCLINRDETHGNMAARYVYQGNGLWAYQYVISQISFTAAQQKAIDSGVTQEYLSTVTSHMQNKDNPHNITPEKLGLADVAVSGSYNDLADARELTTLEQGTGNAVTDIDVSDHTITLTKGATFLTEHPEISVNPPTILSKIATTFSVVDSITRDKDGHLTDFNVTEVSLPAEINTVSYSDLVKLRDNGELVTGTSYKIRDYEFKSDLENVTSGNHPFCIILKATSKSTLSPIATATAIPGDEYFAGVPLDQWKLLYTLDNKVSSYPWGSATGKGIVYYMKDHNGNECCYDFKNLKFLRPSIDLPQLGTPNYYYTFSSIATENDITYIKDASNTFCKDNKIGLYGGTVGDNIFICTDETAVAYSNILRECSNNTFIGLFTHNTFVDRAVGNKFTGMTKNCMFGSEFSRNTIHSGLLDCAIGSNVTDNIFYQDLSYGTIRGNLSHTYTYTAMTTFDLYSASYLSIACCDDADASIPLENREQHPLHNIKIDGDFNGSESTRILINIPLQALDSHSTVYVELDDQGRPVCNWLSDKLLLTGYYKEDLYAAEWIKASYEFLKPSDMAQVAFSGSYNDLTDKPTLTIQYGDTSGNAITNISVDDHTITVDKSLIFLKQGDIEEISSDDLNELLAIFSTSSETT